MPAPLPPRPTATPPTTNRLAGPRVAVLGLAALASLALFAPGCAQSSPGRARGDIGDDAYAVEDTSAGHDAAGDAGDALPADTVAPHDGDAAGGVGDDTAGDAGDDADTALDALSDLAGAADGADGGADSGADETSGDSSCAVTITHAPVTTAPFGPLDISAEVAESGGASLGVVLRYRAAAEGDPWHTLAMTEGPAGHFHATIPASAQTPAGLDYRVEAEAGSCGGSSPEAAAGPQAAHHVKLWGELPIAVGPTYYYHPAVWRLTATYSREEAGGLQDNVVAADLALPAGPTPLDVTSLPKPQGQSDIWGRNIVWVDGRFQANDGDPNLEIYLWDRETQTEHRVTDAPLGQYGVTIHGRIIAWRDDRHMVSSGGAIDGDIYLYDMGPDATFGTADDVGEIRLTPHPADQTAPDVWTDPATGRVRVVWYDFRDDADGICDKQCDWNVYLYDFGEDGVYGTADDRGPTRLTSDPLEQKSPVIDGRRVVWLDARGGDYLDPDIYMYDLGPDGLYGTADDGGESLVDVPTEEPDDLDLDGDRLVFEDFRAGSWEIFVYDLATGVETQLTDLPGGQFYPRIHGDLVVWQDTRNNAAYGDLLDDIYGYVLP